MTADQYIDNLKRSNKTLFAANSFKMTPATLELLLRRAHKDGYDTGWSKALLFEEQRPKSVFDSIFGKLPPL